MKKVYVDANIFVDAVVPTREYHNRSKRFFELLLKRKDVKLCTSVFTQLEIASAIRRHVGKRRVWKFLYEFQKRYGQVSWLYPTKHDEVYDFEKLVSALIDTSILSATPSGDTIHVHTMKANRIKTLITRDKNDFKELKGRKEVLTPEEFLELLSVC